LKTKLKILHLEDIPTDAELVERELKKGEIQFEKLVVDNKLDFKKALKEFVPDIIISDHTLPSFDSIEAIKIIKHQKIKIPFILVTATVSDEYAVEVMKAGADDYILKDRLHRLPKAVESAMEKTRAEQKLLESESFNKGVLSSLASHIAVINKEGSILLVNKAWDNFAKKNGETRLSRVSEGSNYFDVCEKSVLAGDPFAKKTLEGIKSVLRKEKVIFELEYPCHSPNKNQWFLLSVINFGRDTHKVVISHQNITERKIAEKNFIDTSIELQNTLAKLNKILDSSSDIICTINADGEFVNVSAASQQVLGYTPEELIGIKFMNLVYEDDVEITSKAAEKIFRNAQIPIFENRYVHKNGKIVPLLWSVNWDKKLRLMYCVAKDVTERKKSDKENKFKANLLNTIGQAAIATDLNGVVNYWNRAAEHIYGWTKKEALGKHIVELTTSETTSEQAMELIEELKKKGKWSGEFKVQKKDGTNFPALITNSPIYDENNIFSGMIGISSDNTEQKKLELLLDKSNRLARIGSWEIDVVKETVYWSDITKEIREVDKDYIPNLSTGIGFFTEGINKEIISQRVQQCIDNGTPWDEELQITTFKGNLKWVRTIGEGEFYNGKCLKIQGSFQDITERKIAQEALKEQNKALKKTNAELDRFVYSTSHDLRAPLTSLLGLINIVDRNFPEAEADQRERIGMMKQSVTKLDSFIEDIINYSRNSRTEIEKVDIHFEALVNESLQALKYMEGEHICKINVEVVQMGKFISDNKRILVNLNNLIGNAIKYHDKSKQNSYVTISIHSDDSKATIKVEDNGIGIAEDKQSKIFEMFYRGTKFSQGSGLGMYIVKETLEKLNGTITLNSKINVGSTFAVSIPNLIENR
jgi:PAS domain S-box-containing protein